MSQCLFSTLIETQRRTFESSDALSKLAVGESCGVASLPEGMIDNLVKEME